MMRRGMEWSRFLASGLLTLGLCLLAAIPAAAHSLGSDGDPSHLTEDLLAGFGLPLAVLVVGALVGVGLATWLGRGEAAGKPDEMEPAGDDGMEAVEQPGRLTDQRRG